MFNLVRLGQLPEVSYMQGFGEDFIPTHSDRRVCTLQYYVILIHTGLS